MDMENKQFFLMGQELLCVYILNPVVRQLKFAL